MTDPISPDAVIDAIARCFPDGFEFDDNLGADGFAWAILEAINSDLDVFDYGEEIIRCTLQLEIDGRLRVVRLSEFDDEEKRLTLSWSEQARRVLRAMGAPTEHAQIDRIAAVLAGQVKPGAAR